MAVLRRGFLIGVCAVLIMAIANAEAASVVVGLAKCADCTRKNMKAEQAFKGNYYYTVSINGSIYMHIHAYRCRL